MALRTEVSRRIPGVDAARGIALLGMIATHLMVLVSADGTGPTTVGLVFAVAASTLCPLLVLGIWWRGLTAAGAAAGLIGGGTVSLVAASLSVFGIPEAWVGGWAATILGYPAAVSVPLAFGSMYLVSKATSRTIPVDIGGIFTQLHAPERLGVGKDREGEL